MYDDPRCIKDNPIKFKVDDFDFDEFKTIVSLCGKKQPATIAREIFLLGVDAWHKRNSIGLGAKQKEIFSEQMEA